jgi:hypothetical protein
LKLKKDKDRRSEVTERDRERDVLAVELSGNHDRRTFEDQIDDGWFLETAVDENVVRQSKEPCIALKREPPNTPATPNM